MSQGCQPFLIPENQLTKKKVNKYILAQQGMNYFHHFFLSHSPTLLQYKLPNVCQNINVNAN